MKKLIPLFVVALIFSSCSNNSSETKYAWLDNRAWNKVEYVKRLAVLKMNFPETAKFDKIDAGIEDTDLHTFSIAGRATTINNKGEHLQMAFAGVFVADSLGSDSLLSFKTGKIINLEKAKRDFNSR